MRVVRELFSAIDQGEIDRVRSLLASDFALNILGLDDPIDEDGLLEAIQYFFGAFPDTTHQIQQVFAAGDRVTAIILNEATSVGPYEGAEATGERVSFYAIHVLGLVDGRIQNWWALEDNLSLMQELNMELVLSPDKER